MLLTNGRRVVANDGSTVLSIYGGIVVSLIGYYLDLYIKAETDVGNIFLPILGGFYLSNAYLGGTIATEAEVAPQVYADEYAVKNTQYSDYYVKAPTTDVLFFSSALGSMPLCQAYMGGAIGTEAEVAPQTYTDLYL